MPSHKSLGFITRDGISPTEFRRIAYQELNKYPSIEFKNTEITSITKNKITFELMTSKDEKYLSKTIIICTGLKEILPDVDNISYFYGKSLFSCPYCDGWELKDKSLVVIIEEQKQVVHYTQMIYNWSKDLVVCTNGKAILSNEEKNLHKSKGIKIKEHKIKSFDGKNGQVEQLNFKNGETISIKGGFVLTRLIQSDFAKRLGCENNSTGGIAIDPWGRTNIPAVYAAGDGVAPGQLIIAAAEGVRAAVGVNMDFVQMEFST